ncbi:MAG: hypothetical protein E7140_00980 [Rikenellaceae bacterium]|nr:hypothetical protein [Rikenellaceae bacterium]
MKRLTLLLVGVVALTAQVSAQKVLGNGQVSGSLETSSTLYTPDKKIERPDDHFGSNNYLKVDYANGRFSAGIQVNAFLPALVGYDALADGKKFYLASKYIQWRDKNFDILVGDIFDQYGNGLIFRAFEDRQLGINNSLEGVRVGYNFGRYVAIKGMYGRPRLYTEYSKSWVRGADLSVSLADIMKASAITFNIEGSYVNRYQSLSQATEYWNRIHSSTMGTDHEMTRLQYYGVSPNLNLYSGRVNFGWNGLTVRGEYVGKGKDIDIDNKYEKGWAALGEVGYSYKTFSVMGTFRAINNISTMIDVFVPELENGNQNPINTSGGNTINYVPALTRQYTYMLANLNPYQVKPAEMGGQIDLCYSYRSKTNRYRYWNFHANFSTFYSLDKIAEGNRMLYWRDINVDVERQWNKKWKTLILYSFQDNDDHQAHIFVGDVTHKFNRKMSLRFEVQYLLSGDDSNEWDGMHSEGDWVAGLVEFNLAPHWSFYVQDMYNIGQSKMHYYNGGVSYTYNRTRVQLSYGRNRAGYICSGGVCRYSPAYTGVNLMLTSSF